VIWREGVIASKQNQWTRGSLNPSGFLASCLPSDAFFCLFPVRRPPKISRQIRITASDKVVAELRLCRLLFSPLFSLLDSSFSIQIGAKRKAGKVQPGPTDPIHNIK